MPFLSSYPSPARVSIWFPPFRILLRTSVCVVFLQLSFFNLCTVHFDLFLQPSHHSPWLENSKALLGEIQLTCFMFV